MVGFVVAGHICMWVGLCVDVVVCVFVCWYERLLWRARAVTLLDLCKPASLVSIAGEVRWGVCMGTGHSGGGESLSTPVARLPCSIDKWFGKVSSPVLLYDVQDFSLLFVCL